MKKSNFARFKDLQELLHSLCFAFFAKIFHSPLNKENNTMRNYLSKIVLAATLGLALALTISCNSDCSSGSKNTDIIIDKRAIGTWEDMNNKTWTFNSDGTGISGGTNMKYAFFSDKIVFHQYFSTLAFNYAFSADGKTFIMYNMGITGGSFWLTKKE